MYPRVRHRHTEDGQSHTLMLTSCLHSTSAHRMHTDRGTDRQVPSSSFWASSTPKSQEPSDSSPDLRPFYFLAGWEIEGCQLITPYRHPHTPVHTHSQSWGRYKHRLPPAVGTCAMTCGPTPVTRTQPLITVVSQELIFRTNEFPQIWLRMKGHGMKSSWSFCGSSCPQMGLGVESRLPRPTLRTAAVMTWSSTLLDPARLLERAGLGAEVQ